MSLITRLRDQKNALDYIENELGEDNAYYKDVKSDFSHRKLFMFSSIATSAALLVGTVAFYRVRYGDVGTFMTIAFLSVFVIINIACAVFENSTRTGFWKWNRYYNLWIKYDKSIPIGVLRVLK